MCMWEELKLLWEQQLCCGATALRLGNLSLSESSMLKFLSFCRAKDPYSICEANKKLTVDFLEENHPLQVLQNLSQGDALSRHFSRPTGL